MADTTTVGKIEYNLSINTASYNKGLDESKKKLAEAKKEAEENFKTMSDGFEKASKVAKRAFTAVATAIGSVATAAVKNFADYEQLVGGVDTLFKDSSKQIQEYAASAYKTAGLSANQYMEQATSFASRLIRDTGGNTERAAELANMAIIDMSDNVNKMGTSMEAVQHAYEGLAKGNATMLDNLKVGYGGTQTEMLQLAKDMGVVDASVKSFNDISFEDAVLAIHKVQDQLGITGTTAEEAEGTISGSFNSMRSAWDNFTVALADPNGDVSGALDNLLESVGIFLDQAVPRLQEAIGNIFDTLWERSPVLMTIATVLGVIGAAIIAINTALTIYKTIKTAINTVEAAFNVIMNANPIFLLATVILTVVAALALFFTQTEAGKAFIQSFGETVGNVFNAIKEGFQGVWNFVTGLFGNIVNFFRGVLTSIVNIFIGIGQAVGNAVTGAFKSVVNGVLGFVEGFINGPINLLNGFLGVINGAFGWLGVNIGYLPTVHLPRMATGGVVESTRGGQAIIAGEAGEDEWVIPESKFASLLNELEERGAGGDTYNINVDGVFATSASERRKVADQIVEAINQNNRRRFLA